MLPKCMGSIQNLVASASILSAKNSTLAGTTNLIGLPFLSGAVCSTAGKNSTQRTCSTPPRQLVVFEVTAELTPSSRCWKIASVKTVGFCTSGVASCTSVQVLLSMAFVILTRGKYFKTTSVSGSIPSWSCPVTLPPGEHSNATADTTLPRLGTKYERHQGLVGAFVHWEGLVHSLITDVIVVTGNSHPTDHSPRFHLGVSV